MKRLVFDLDDTICRTRNGDYVNSVPVPEVIEKIRQYKSEGFDIVIATSRNVRTFDGNVGKINAVTLPIIINWLNVNQVPYDEIIVGKPWCGLEGFYVDDKAIRPSEFIRMSYQEIRSMLASES